MDKADKPRAFFYHLNKPKWRQTGKVRWSVHQADTCHIVSAVICEDVRTQTRSRSRQPIAVVTGKGFVRVEKDVAYISRKKVEKD